MTATAEDVAAYVLRALGRTHTLKLQKLLYYIQAWTIVATDRPLFNEEIRAFEKGPVVYELWSKYRSTYWFEPGDLEGDPEQVPAELEPVIDSVLEHYGKFERFDLVEMTHEDAPWNDVWHHRTARHSDRIDIPLIRDFYLAQHLAQDVETPHVPAVPGGITWVSREILDSLDDEDIDAAAAAWGSSVARARAALQQC